MIARSITLDTSRAGSQLSMTVRKGETSIYSLAVSFCEKGTPIYVPDTYTAILRGYKADGTAVSRNATITGGRVTTGFPEQSFTAVGVAQFEIDCYGPGGEVLFSPEFDVLVEDTVSEGAVQSSNDFTALQQALMQANRGFVIQGVPYASIGALKAAITEPNMGDLYEVVDGFAYDIYRWTGDTSVGDDGWLNHGHISGKSAYEVAVDGGYAGTQAEWLASLVGASGTPGEPGGTGEPGAAGTSAYLHIRWGTSATPSTLLEIPDEYIGVASTSNAIAPATYDGYVWYKYKGEDGSPGAPGEPGAPGDPGTPGASAYVHIRWGTSATPETLLTSPADYIGIVSSSNATAPTTYDGYSWYLYKGADGDAGQGVPSGGTAGQALVKSSATDYATEWAAVGRTNQQQLINWDFRKPVNQLGISAFTVGQYGLDMWLLSSGACAINSGSITLNGVLTHRMEWAPSSWPLNGKVCTLSVLLTDGSVKNVTITPSASADVDATVDGITIGLYNGANWKEFRITTSVATNMWAAKVEFGSVSTLAYDAPMDYGAQLALCQRHYVKTPSRFSVGYYSAADNTGIFLHTPVRMRATPTLTVLAADGIFDRSGTYILITEIPLVYAVADCGVIVRCTFASAPAAGQIQMVNTLYELSARLL